MQTPQPAEWQHAQQAPGYPNQQAAYQPPVHPEQQAAYQAPMHGDPQAAYQPPLHPDQQPAYQVPMQGNSPTAYQQPVHYDETAAYQPQSVPEWQQPIAEEPWTPDAPVTPQPQQEEVYWQPQPDSRQWQPEPQIAPAPDPVIEPEPAVEETKHTRPPLYYFEEVEEKRAREREQLAAWYQPIPEPAEPEPVARPAAPSMPVPPAVDPTIAPAAESALPAAAQAASTASAAAAASAPVFGLAGGAPRPQVKEGIGPQLPRPNRVRVPTRRELASYGIKLPSQRMAEERAREDEVRQPDQHLSDDDADMFQQNELARQFAATQHDRYGEEYQHETPQFDAPQPEFNEAEAEEAELARQFAASQQQRYGGEQQAFTPEDADVSPMNTEPVERATAPLFTPQPQAAAQPQYQQPQQQHYQQPAAQPPMMATTSANPGAELKIYDTSSKPLDQVLAQVQQDGASIVVGPLLKNNVEELMKSNTTLNVLALNQPEQVQNRANICYFALSPEDEARDAARHIHEQGKQAPLLLIPRSTLGDRVANAFADEWQKLGGGIVLQQKFGSASELRAGVNGGAGIALNGSPVSASLPQQQSVTIGGLSIPAPPTDAQISGGGKVDAAYIVATPQEIAFIKPMIAMRNGSQSGATLYASSRSAQGTAGPDFRLEMEGLQYSEIPMLAGSNPALMQQALSTVRNDYSLARLYAMGVDAWALANHFTQMRQVPGFELNGNTGDLTANQDCVINRKLSWLKYQQGQIVPAS